MRRKKIRCRKRSNPSIVLSHNEDFSSLGIADPQRSWRSCHLDSEALPDVLVDDVANADRRRHFEEVRRQAAVETGRTFVPENACDDAGHRPVVAVRRRWRSTNEYW